MHVADRRGREGLSAVEAHRGNLAEHAANRAVIMNDTGDSGGVKLAKTPAIDRNHVLLPECPYGLSGNVVTKLGDNGLILAYRLVEGIVQFIQDGEYT